MSNIKEDQPKYKASLEELKQVKGPGGDNEPRILSTIVGANGKFKSVDNVENLWYWGFKTIEKLKDYVTEWIKLSPNLSEFSHQATSYAIFGRYYLALLGFVCKSVSFNFLEIG